MCASMLTAATSTHGASTGWQQLSQRAAVRPRRDVPPDGRQGHGAGPGHVRERHRELVVASAPTRTAATPRERGSTRPCPRTMPPCTPPTPFCPTAASSWSAAGLRTSVSSSRRSNVRPGREHVDACDSTGGPATGRRRRRALGRLATETVGASGFSGTADQAIFDAASLGWTTTGAGKADGNGEEGYSAAAGRRKVLTIDAKPGSCTTRNTEIYDPPRRARGRALG